MNEPTTPLPPPPDTPPPPPPPKARRKPRTTPPAPLAAAGTPVPLHPDPDSVPYQDLGATLAEAAEAASKAAGESESDISPDAAVAAHPPAPAGRPLDEIAKDYKAASEGGLWSSAVLADEAVKAHGDHSLARLAVLVNVPRPRLTEHAQLGRFFGSEDRRCDGVSPSAHLYGLRLAKRRSKPEATDADLRDLARVILMQTPECVKIQALIRAEKGMGVPKDGSEPMDPSPAPSAPTGVERALASIRDVRDFLDGGPAEEDLARVVAALEEVVAWAKSPKLTPFQPIDDPATSAA